MRQGWRALLWGVSHHSAVCFLQGETPPPLSPVLTNGASLMEANLKPTTPEPRGSNASLDGSEAGSRPASESGEVAAAKEAHKKGRFKVRTWLRFAGDRRHRDMTIGFKWQLCVYLNYVPYAKKCEDV